MYKRILIILIVIFFIATNLYLYRSNMSLKKLIEAEQAEFDERLKSEHENVMVEVKKELDEKYRADITSYKAMTKRLELEKKKMKKLEEEIGELKGPEDLY